MNRFCTACGKPLDDDIQFCGACGKPVKRSGEAAAPETPSAEKPPTSTTGEVPPITPAASPEETRGWATEDPPESVFAAAPSSPIPPEPDPAYFEDNGERNDIRKYLIGGGAIFLLLIAGLYYWLFLSDDIGRSEGGRPTAAQQKPADEKAAEARVFYATSTANIRNVASTDGSEVTGKLKRGDEAKGNLITAEDGGEWLELADDGGFVFAANLSANEMPVLAKSLGRKSITLASAVDLWSAPEEGSELLDRLSKGLSLNISGITENDYAEVILRKGGVGYIANGAKVVKDGDGPKGPAIAIALDVQKCASGPDIDALFKKLDGQYDAALKKVEDADYPDDAARDAAVEKFQRENETKSRFLKVQRSFKGLQMTGIGRHYESQSVYFAEPPEKVIEVFKGLGEKIDKDGQLQSRDIYSGIGAAAGDAKKFAKSDLSCGV